MEEKSSPVEGQSNNQNKIQEDQPQTSMESLLEQEELALDFPRQGEIRQGIVVSISEDEILVGIGTKSEGVIPKRELEQLTPEDKEKFVPGEEISVYVITPEDQQGNLLLSHTRALEEGDWVKAENLLQSGDVYEGMVEGYNKGGLIVRLGMLRGFVPGSQISLARRMAYSGNTPDQRWGKMVGEPIATRVIEVDRERRRLILSERAALQEARELLKERLLDELEEGQVRIGRVTSLADFGAFVNINGADGLVHLTEISWERIKHPSEVLKVGQEVQVKVIDVDRDRKRIGLSIRQLLDDPWPQKIGHLKVGQLIEGRIVRLVKFGAFARIGELDVEGLIHISELSDQRIEHPKEVVHDNDVLTLRVINIDAERRRIGLSLRKVDSPAYAELDWELALAEGVEEESEVETAEAEVEIPADVEETEPVDEEPAGVEQLSAEGEVEIPEGGEDEVAEQAEEKPPVAEQSDDELSPVTSSEDAEEVEDEEISSVDSVEEIESSVDEEISPIDPVEEADDEEISPVDSVEEIEGSVEDKISPIDPVEEAEDEEISPIDSVEEIEGSVEEEMSPVDLVEDAEKAEDEDLSNEETDDSDVDIDAEETVPEAEPELPQGEPDKE